MIRASLLLTVTAGVVMAGSAYAHHSLGSFDRATTLTVSGTVTEFQWTSPHVWIEIVTDGGDGMFENWSIQGSSPQILARSGWRPTFLKPGDRISLGVHPLKDGGSGGYLADAEALVVNGHEVVPPLRREGEDELNEDF